MTRRSPRRASASDRRTNWGRSRARLRIVPVVFLLVGLTGSGMTTHARRCLEPIGAVRLSV